VYNTFNLRFSFLSAGAVFDLNTWGVPGDKSEKKKMGLPRPQGRKSRFARLFKLKE
jgi:hypothetical protein